MKVKVLRLHIGFKTKTSAYFEQGSLVHAGFCCVQERPGFVLTILVFRKILPRISLYMGWQATLDRYHRTYPDRAAMGTLTFDLRAVRVLSAQWAVVFGGYQLERAEDRPSGLFTLLFEKRPEGWRIVHDHTSSS